MSGKGEDEQVEKRLDRLKIEDVARDRAIGCYKAWAEAFSIFAKYDERGDVAAEHDEVFAGPDCNVMSDEDLVRLAALGWTPNTDVGGFSKFT